MNPESQTLLYIVVFCVMAAALGYYSHLAAKRRREELAALASQLGWKFYPDRDDSHDEEFAHFEIFRRGHSRYSYNSMYGELTIDEKAYSAKMGDFTYKVTSHNGKSSSTTTYRFSYLILELPFGQVPSLVIRREGMFDKLKGMLGFDDIDFESAEFSRRFFVKSSDKRFAYDVIDPRMIEFLLNSDAPTIDIENGRGLFADGKRSWSPAQFRDTIGWAQEFFDHWPDHVQESLS